MMANRIYMHKDFNENANHTANVINNFVSDKTDGRITDIVKSQDFDNNRTYPILIDAISLRSQHHIWLNRFRTVSVSENANKDENGNLTMFLLGGHFLKVRKKDWNATAARIDYKNSSLSLMMIEPWGNDISTLEKRMKNYTLSAINKEMASCWQMKCDIAIPKARIETAVDLSDILKKVMHIDPLNLSIQWQILNLVYFFFFCSRWALPRFSPKMSTQMVDFWNRMKIQCK